MSRITTVLSDARDILSDVSSERWTDARLISLYNQGLRDMVIQTKALHGKLFVEIEANINTYIMPDEVLKISRVQYLDTAIPVISHEKMDESDALWETRTGAEVKAVITNMTNASTFKIYPVITDATQDYITSNSNYGGIIDIAVTDNVFNLPNIADLNNIPKFLVVYYIKVPDTVTIATLDADLQFNSTWDNALIHYIAGMALRDDADQQNRVFGGEELQIYGGYVAEIKGQETSSFTANPNSTFGYRGFE